MGTPSLANLDNDDYLEIVFAGYTTSGDIFAINHDGTNVNNFPVDINEKVLNGVAIYDLNNNGKDDIVVATENEKLIQVIYDDGSIENLFTSDDKFKAAPSILDNNGKPLPSNKHQRKKIDATFLITWQNVITIMHYPNRENYDFPYKECEQIGFKLNNNNSELFL